MVFQFKKKIISEFRSPWIQSKLRHNRDMTRKYGTKYLYCQRCNKHTEAKRIRASSNKIEKKMKKPTTESSL